MKRAIAVSFNWNTGEILQTTFEGDGCAEKAAGWVHPKSFIAKDFPESEGWEHFAHWSKQAGEERAAKLAEELCSKGTMTITYPE